MIRTITFITMLLMASCNSIDCRHTPGPGPAPIELEPVPTSLPTATPTASSTPDAGPATEVTWLEWEQAQADALALGRPVLVYFRADWCGYCRLVDENVWTDPEVLEFVSGGYVATQVDIEDDPHGLRERFAVKGVPRIIVWDPRDREVKLRIQGWYEDLDVYRDALD